MAWTRAMAALEIETGLVPAQPGAFFTYLGLVMDPSMWERRQS